MKTPPTYLAAAVVFITAGCSSPPENDPVVVPPQPGTREGNPPVISPNSLPDEAKPVDDVPSSTSTTGTGTETDPEPEPAPPTP